MTLFLTRGTGFLTRLHPLTKLLVLLVLFLLPFGGTGIGRQLLLLASVLVLVFVARGAENLLRLRAVLIGIFAGSLLLWTLLGPGSGSEGLDLLSRFRFALAMALRFATLLVSGVLYLTIAAPEEFTAALVAIGLPDRAAFTILLAFRWVPLLYESLEGVREAQLSRGIPLDRGEPIARLRRQIPSLVPAMHDAIRRAERTTLALFLRGFGAGRRTRPELPPFRAPDGIAWGLSFAALAHLAGDLAGIW